MKKFSKGFTIIELIVVIAIIAVLAGIVLVNVTSYIAKAKDTSIKAELDLMVKSASMYFEITGASDSSGLCGNSPSGFGPVFVGAKKQAPGSYGNCNTALSGSNNTAWAVYVKLNNKDTCATTGYWCVDSTGVKKLECADPGVALSCP